MNHLTFFDFCAGIGSGRIALQNLGAECVGFSEIDPKVEATYSLFFGKEKNHGDLMKIDPEVLPEFDLMIGGFPCQTFSIVGKRNGMQDERGQIILGLVNILKAKRVKYFLLENVKGILHHNGGETLKIILQLLREAGYFVDYRNLNSVDYGIPQKRERVYFVGYRADIVDDFFNFAFPEKIRATVPIEELLINRDSKYIFNDFSENWNTFKKYLENKYNRGKFNLKNLLSEEYLVLDTRQSDLRLYRGESPTLRTGRHGILYVKRGELRRLSGEESLLLQGFPTALAKKAEENLSTTTILSQAGNAMTVNVMQAIGRCMLAHIEIKNKHGINLSDSSQIPMMFNSKVPA